MNLSIIIACHNRKELTLRCIESARIAAANAGASISFTLFDDGSTDGTAEAVSSLADAPRILRGDGSAFWASSMAQAEAAVLADSNESSVEHIVWLNDDVSLDVDAFRALAETILSFPGSVIVGATRDAETGEVTYAGMRRSGLHPLRFEVVTPTGLAQRVQAFNGNLVVVPFAIAKELGGIDGGFSHALADIDYGLRCGRAGIPVILGPKTYGSCKRNEIPQAGRLQDDWKAFIGPKGGGNYPSLRRILGKSHPGSWPLFISATYGLWWMRRIAGMFRGKLVTK